jgi:hypothetical protein
MGSPTLDKIYTAAMQHADPECAACGFRKHCHGEHSHICPILVKGLLSQFHEVTNG